MRTLFLALLLASCAEATPPHLVLDAEGVITLAGADPEHPRLRYLDGQISSNSSCAIRLPNKLNPRIPPMYLNGAPVGFC